MRKKREKKPKLLFIVQLPPPIHGASLRNRDIIESKLLNKNFNIRIIPLRFAKKLENLSKFSFGKIIKTISILFKLKYELLFQRPDIVFFTFSPNGYAFLRDSLFILILKIFLIKKVIVFRERILKNRIKFRILSFLLKNSEIIVLSKFIKNDLPKIKNIKINIIYDGIKTMVSDSEIKNKKQNKKPLILFLSNLILNKGIFVFLESLNILNKKGIDFAALIVGAPVDISEQKLLKKIKELDLSDKIKCSGFIKGDKRFEIYLKSDIFILPTLKESFPGVILEAMQSGLPVISTLEGGIPEIVDDGKTGFLVPKNNYNLLADKIEYLIKNREIAMEMGFRGREKFLRNFSYEEMEKNINNFFSDILNR
jgi:glycosyltransferase involved in cell wall biosynthesis